MATANLAAMADGMTAMVAVMAVSAEEDFAASADAVIRSVPSYIHLFFHFLFISKLHVHLEKKRPIMTAYLRFHYRGALFCYYNTRVSQ